MRSSSSSPTPAGSRFAAAARRAADTLVGSDPGLARLISALEVMTAVLVSVGVLYAFTHLTHVLWIEAPALASPAALAEVAEQHRDITLLVLILGGVLSLMASFLVLETRPREQALTLALMPLPMLLTLALSIKLEPHREVGIAVMALVIALGVYARRFVPRFGPRAVLYGNMLFVGYFFGFLSGGALAERQLGWLALVMAITVAVNLALKQGWNAVRARRFERLRRDLVAQSRSVAAATLDLWVSPTPRRARRARRRLHRRLTGWSAAALTADALIAESPDAGHGATIHQALFDLELAVQNVARFAELLTAATLAPGQHAIVAGWLEDLTRAAPGEPVPVPAPTEGMAPRAAAWLEHLEEAVADQRAAVEAWGAEIPPPPTGARPAFESSVTLLFGNLPGSSLAGAAAAGEREWLSPAARTAIRVAVAVGAASIVGSLLSRERYYWAVIAVFIAFMGAETSAEQIRKASHRVVGSVVGIVLGSLLAHAIGPSGWSLAAIVLSLGIGVYFMTINYAIMVVGITVMVSLLYEQLHELTDQLLLLRVEETAIGAVIAVIAALTIFPVDTRRAARIAADRSLEALDDLLGKVRAALGGGAEEAEGLTAASRALDHETQQLLTTARPLGIGPRRRVGVWDALRLYAEAAHHARNLVGQVPRVLRSGADVGEDLLDVLEREREVVGGVRPLLLDPDAPIPERPAAAIAAVHQRLIDEGHDVQDPQRRLVRHLRRIDDGLGQVAVRLADPAADAPVPPSTPETTPHPLTRPGR